MLSGALAPVDYTPGKSLRSYGGCCNENVTLKKNFALSNSFAIIRCWSRRSALSLAWHEGFSSNGKEWKINCCGFALSSELQVWTFHVVVWPTTSKHCSRKRAAREARLFLLIQSIKSLICGVVVAVVIRQRRRHTVKWRIWLVKWGKISVLYVQHAF